MRATGYEGDHLSAVAAAWWTGLARTFRDELTDAEFAALSAGLELDGRSGRASGSHRADGCTWADRGDWRMRHPFAIITF